MAGTQFRDAIINFGSTVNGTINGTGSVTFPTNVINATAAIKKWNAAYNTHDNQVLGVGAAINNVTFSGNQVQLQASITFYDDDRAEGLNASMTVAVIAHCE